MTMLIPERHREAHLEGMNCVFATGQGRIIGRVTELHALRRDGMEFPIELSLANWEADGNKFATGIIRDITKRKEEEEELHSTQVQLIQSENMVTLGKLTAGIHHEINSPIGTIISNIDMTKFFFNPTPKFSYYAT